MNKTIIININGTVFHIEEDAYEVLKNYMTDVKRHFFNSADSLEITTDIENRIAEMFSDLLQRENRQVIIEQDVRAIIEQMGTVEDFANAEKDEPQIAAEPVFNTDSRRLFRDPDDHLIAGVCSGIANYFDIQALWVRLLFAFAFVFFGTGFFLYIILWIVIPKAVTRADRMAMKGEKLNLQGFKRNFEEEMSSVQGKFSDMRHDARPFVYKTRDFIGDFFSHLGAFLNGTGKVLVKVVGIVVMLGCLGCLIGLAVSVFMFFVFGDNGVYQLFPFNIVSSSYSTIFMVCSFLMMALPLIGIILLTTRLIFNKSVVSRSGAYAMLTVWVACLSVVIYYSAKVAADFKSGASFSQTVNLKPAATNTYYLKLNDVKYLSAEDSVRLNIKDRFNGKIILDVDDDDVDMESPGNDVFIEIERGDVKQPVLIESFSARGRNYVDALQNAQNATYQFIQQDSVLKFDRRLRKKDGKLWRNQELHLTLKVPMNTKLVIDQDLDRYLRGVSIYDCLQNAGEGTKATSALFIMTENGLECGIKAPVTDTTTTDVKVDSARIDTAHKAKP